MNWFKSCTEEEHDEYLSSDECIKIHNDGEIAYNLYHVNKPYVDCPYDIGTKEYHAWHLGWSSQRYN